MRTRCSSGDMSIAREHWALSNKPKTRLVPVTVTAEPHSVTLLGIAPEAAQRGERANSHVSSLSGLGRSSVETQEPSIVDKGGEIPKKIEVPTQARRHNARNKYSPAQIRFCPVDRNRRIPNGPSGGVGGLRG